MQKRAVFALLVLVVSAAMIATSCGGDNGTGGDGGGTDGTLDDGSGGDSGCWSNCGDGGTCSNLASKCTANGDCCSGNCLNGACQPGACTSDNQACTSDNQCCGHVCGTNKTCTPANGSCATLGNTCKQNSECCSSFCENGICAQPSYCGQDGEICLIPADCCGGICTIVSGKTYGLCTQPPSNGAQCKAIDGVVCSSSDNGDAGFLDSGLPACGGACCSRDCAPWGPTHVLICQPASGCHPVGDLCTKDTDCCGGQGTSPTQTCNKSGSDPVGVCSNPTGCKPNGDICRLQTNQCNATDNCCSGNVQQKDTCKQDNLGVPRCSYAGDAGCIPVDAGTQCASSADCCNLDPCVPDGKGGFTCYPSTCVPVTGVCTNDADCCPGGHCYIPGGQTSGTCQPTSDGGCTGAQYGQVCTVSSDCCNGIPCTNGRCEIPVN
jgi:hypothetical protein